MQAREVEVRLPVVVAKDATEVLEHAHGAAAALRVWKEQRPKIIAKCMEPQGLAVHIDAGFVGIQETLLDQLSLNDCLERPQEDVRFLVEVEERPSAEELP